MFAFSVIVASCNSTAPSTEAPPTHQTVTAPITSKLNDTATKQLSELLVNYYMLKDALIANNAEKANAAAKELATSIDNFNNALKSDNTMWSAMSLNIDTLKIETNKIIISNSTKVSEIRTTFAKISGPLFALCRSADLKNANVYLAHCPMALNDTGANWLSSYAEIKNPYFGDKMLDCGDVEDSLK